MIAACPGSFAHEVLMHGAPPPKPGFTRIVPGYPQPHLGFGSWREWSWAMIPIWRGMAQFRERGGMGV